MCGIAGFFGDFKKQKAAEVALKYLSARGPDGEGVLETKSGLLVHTRLAIIDISQNANQPFLSEDNRYAIVFNGEIYNHKELRIDLERLGYRFKTNSDTEVLLKGLIHFGPTFLSKLRGMFAFAFYSYESDELLLARDHLGIKPLYYALNENGLAFASNKSTLLNSIPNYFKLSWDNLVLGTQFGGCPQPLTVWEGMMSVPGGFYANWSLVKGFTLKQWWDVPSEDNFGISNSHDFSGLIEAAIKDNLVSDVALGLMLSGGLDSTLLCSFLAKMPVKAFTVFDQGDPFEMERAKQIAKECHLEHFEIFLEQVNYSETLVKSVRIFEEPLPYLDPQLLMAESLEKKGIKVVLNGLGPDEALCGYGYHRYLRSFWKNLWLGIDKTSLSNNKIFKMLSLRDGWDFYLKMHYRSQFRIDSIFKPVLTRNFESNFDSFKSYYPKKFSSPIQMITYLDYKIGLGTHHLHSADQFLMEHSIEGRFPYLDHRILEWAFNLKDEEKINSTAGKLPLRELANKHLPLNILKAKKRGFNLDSPHCYSEKVFLLDCLKDLPVELINQEAIQNANKTLMNESPLSAVSMYTVQLGVWLHQLKSLPVRL